MNVLYRGSVKDLLGPVQIGGEKAVIFDYSDAYSVFDWGRMPDALPRKGHALAVLAAHLFEALESPETWRGLSRTPEALALRKANRFGSVFNELGEELQGKGLRTHYLGVLEAGSEKPMRLGNLKSPVSRLAVRQVAAVKPAIAPILGRAIPDYLETRNAPAPRLVPLEVVFRFGCPPGSSLIERAAQNAGYLASIGFGPVHGLPDLAVEPGAKWEFPVLELFTKLESSDRPVTLVEALAISGLPGAKLQEVLLKTAWVAGLLRALFARTCGIELADGKLEWGIDEKGEIILVDAIGPDELRLLKGGVQLSKEFLRAFYRGSPWYEAVHQAKKEAQARGVAEWKRLVAEGPPPLSPETREVATQLYLALTNQLTGKKWFAEAWTVDQVLEGIGKVTA